jgi:hypothetical protein
VNYGKFYFLLISQIFRTQYGLYQDAVYLCNTLDEEKWKKAVFWVFDAPNAAEKPFEVRQNL